MEIRCGWHCPYYDQMRPVPELSYTQTGTGPLVFHTLLFPVAGKAELMPEFSVEAGMYRVAYAGTTWRIEVPGRRRMANNPLKTMEVERKVEINREEYSKF